MVVKVYGPVRAACPQRVLACLVELGVDFEVIHVDLDNGEHKQPPFLARQPFGQVPVIEDGDFRLYESRAIIRYLATKYSDPTNPNKLLGTTLEERATVDQWLEVEAHNFNEPVYTIVLELIVLPKAIGKKTDDALVQSCKDKLDNVLQVYEERLSKSKYLAGDSFTLADLSHLPAMTYLMSDDAKMSHLIEGREFLSAWWKDISGRDSWKEILKLADN